jgi:hypothetical protein
MGFVGSTYCMEIDDTYYDFGFVTEDVANFMAKNKLKELNINYDKEIVFEWDGSL